jgi:transcriptional regulator with XRE-family HTH domain
MIDIGKRLRQLREAKGLSQGHIEERTGLFRCYVSRVECGHTIPQLETLGKWAKALGIPLSELFAEGRETSKPSRNVPAPFYEERLLDMLKLLDVRDKPLPLSIANTMTKHGRKDDKS